MSNYLYAETHEWALADGNEAKVGISEFAAEELGDVVFVDLPSVGDEVTAGKAFCEVESVKAVSEIVAPVSGKIVAVNAELESAPESINGAPLEAWICRIEMSDAKELDTLMDGAKYAEFIKK